MKDVTVKEAGSHRFGGTPFQVVLVPNDKIYVERILTHDSLECAIADFVIGFTPSAVKLKFLGLPFGECVNKRLYWECLCIFDQIPNLYCSLAEEAIIIGDHLGKHLVINKDTILSYNGK